MSELIQPLAALAAGLPGVASVLASPVDRPVATPAVAVELLREQPDDPAEVGAGAPLTLRQTYALAVHAAYGQGVQTAGAARDQAVGLARALRRAIEADPTLGGACLLCSPGPASLAYVTWYGRDYVAVETTLTALLEETA